MAQSTFADDLPEVPPVLFAGGDPAPDEAASPAMVSEIGPYQLLEQMGEGGTGVVYRADIATPMAL